MVSACNLILFCIVHVIKICTCMALVKQSALHFVSFDYTVCLLHHHHCHFFDDFALICNL